MTDVLFKRGSPSAVAGQKPANPVVRAPVVLELPPRIPEDAIEREEAVQLLGDYVKAQGRMHARAMETLRALVGALPRVEDAAAWKSALKRGAGTPTPPGSSPQGEERKPAGVTAELPPRVPEDPAEFERATVLLGAYVKDHGKLKQRHVEELKALLGMVPRLEDATTWKTGLKQLRKLRSVAPS